MAKEVTMCSQLQQWSPVKETAGAPAPPPALGYCYHTPKKHPWRPIMGYEEIEVTPMPSQPITNTMVDPCYTPAGMAAEPLRFPNLVTGFDRSPEHAARAALYTRYTQYEWNQNSIKNYNESDAKRNFSERIRNDIMRSLRETDEIGAQGQRDSGRRIGERITDTTFWRNEVAIEMERLVSTCEKLNDTRRQLERAVAGIEGPLHIVQECLYHREKRQGLEQVHDAVEQSLLREVSILRDAQEKFKNMLEKVRQQSKNCRATQHELESDMRNKEYALGIDSMCHQLNNFSKVPTESMTTNSDLAEIDNDAASRVIIVPPSDDFSLSFNDDMLSSKHRLPGTDFDLKTLLETSPCGKSVLQYYQTHQTLDSKRRNRLTDIIITHLFTTIINKRLTLDDYNIITGKIISLFPKETAGIYFTNSIKKSQSGTGKSIPARGKLVDKVRNIIFQSSERRKTSTEIENTKKKAVDSILLELHQEDIQWLNENNEPFDEVIKKWRATQDVRHGRDYSDVNDFIAHWKVLCNPRAEELGLQFYAGIERYDPTVCDTERWAAASAATLQRSQSERAKATQMLSDTDNLINTAATEIWDQWSNTNSALTRRIAETIEIKNKLQLHLHKVQQEIFDIEKTLELLNKAIEDKLQPMKVAHTRLQARTNRPHLEKCRDEAQNRLVKEVCDLQAAMEMLRSKIAAAEGTHQTLLGVRAGLEADLRNKCTTLFIDRDQCMGIRRGYPVTAAIKA